MNTGERIRLRRKALKISADKLAKKIGVSRSTIFRYENGYIEKVPSEVLTPLSEILQTTPAYLLGVSEIVDQEIIATQKDVKRVVLFKRTKVLSEEQIDMINDIAENMAKQYDGQ